MALRDIDTERFILLIRARTVLWDVSLDDYTNKLKKQQAWLEICKELFANFDRLDQQKKIKIGNHLQKRWKSLRNCYSRELRRAKEPESGVRRKYIYFENLSFLNQNFKYRAALNLEEEEMDLDSSYPEVSVLEEEARHQFDTQHKPSTNTNEEELLPNNFLHEVETISEEEECHTKRKQTHRTSSDFDKLYEVLKDCLKQRPQEPFNGDKMFLLSLLPDLQAIPPERKLLAKMEIMKVISNFKANLIPAQSSSGVSQNYFIGPCGSSEPTLDLVTVEETRINHKQEPLSPSFP